MINVKILDDVFSMESSSGKAITDPFGISGYAYRYRIVLQKEKAQVSFLFTDSIMSYQSGKKELSSDDLISALQCFISDALSGDMSFKDFCAEFGYNNEEYTTQYLESKRIYCLCVKAKEKCIGFFSSDIYDLMNTLSELENNDNLLSIILAEE